MTTESCYRKLRKPLTFLLSTGPIFRIKLFSTNWCLEKQNNREKNTITSDITLPHNNGSKNCLLLLSNFPSPSSIFSSKESWISLLGEFWPLPHFTPNRYVFSCYCFLLFLLFLSCPLKKSQTSNSYQEWREMLMNA